jgi:uncharacterized membrane protein YdjX (TVP38/TMEM64 family)
VPGGTCHAAGFLFGLPAGSLTVWIASTVGAYAAFLVGRTIARDRVAQKMARNEKFAAVDSAIGSRGSSWPRSCGSVLSSLTIS